MKQLHLICNAHIDPVWLWDMEEGVAAALSRMIETGAVRTVVEAVFGYRESYAC